jgi:adenosylcobinamide kinase/adenosylcobinamide-phosphate guanylyltransferase
MIATAEALDAEMAERISRHQADRGPEWRTVEAPVDLSSALAVLEEGDVAVVDCLTLWLSNLMTREMPLPPAFESLMASIDRARADLIFISNEVGLGIVPDNALARRFRDQAGWLHQRLADRADRVLLVIAGLPVVLKNA